MRSTMQFEGMSVWEHGESVAKWYDDLYNHIKLNTSLTLQWRIPTWLTDPRLISKILPYNIMHTYQLYHDIGKGSCRTVDENGITHFPDHAQSSKECYLKVCEGTENDLIIAELIGKDMLAHTVRGLDLQEFANDSLAPSLLYTALAEVHSNAAHLGRLESDGFKIKCKQLDKVAKAILFQEKI